MFQRQDSIKWICLALIALCMNTSHAATHDDLPQCGLTGVYRTRQSVLESPNYPDNYPPNTCWDYVVRSPYRCPTKFHVQFLDFFLETSQNCTNDYLAVGLENDGDDMDLLCGQVIGIKKYHTPDGVLRLRFFADDSPWTTGKGFKLLVTRLACERDDLSRELNIDEDDDTVQINASPSKQMRPPVHGAKVPAMPPNATLQDQHRLLALAPLFGGYNTGSQLPLPPPPVAGLGSYYTSYAGVPFISPVVSQVGQPCVSSPNLPQQTGLSGLQPQQFQGIQQPLQGFQQQLPGFQQLQPQPIQQSSQQPPNLQQQDLPQIADQYQTTGFHPQSPSLKDYDLQRVQQQYGSNLELCCASSFNQNHFYLSSPGFPRTAITSLLPTQQRDCVFSIEKSTPTICRLRITFKFFDFGHGNHDSGIHPTVNQLPRLCSDDFIEIDGQRFCGCRSGYVYTTYWGDVSKKTIRMRLGYDGVHSNGFLLELQQEQDQNRCRDDALHAQQIVVDGVGIGLQQDAFGVQHAPQSGFGALALNEQQQQLGNLAPQQNNFNQLNGFAQRPAFGFNPLAAQYFSPNGLVPQNAYQAPLPPSHLWQTTPAGYEQFGAGFPVPQYRSARRVSYARGIDVQQPAKIVETNSTRKEFYFYDGDEAFARAAGNGYIQADEPDDDVSNRLSTKAFEKSSCTFDYTEMLKLSVDTMWLTKPLCFAPLRSWFSNIFG